jgi:hypothetical protein
MASAPPAGPPAIPPIDLIYGPMLIGVMLNCVLFGIMVMQLFIYYQTYPKDGLWLKLFVAYLAIAETVNTACDMYLVYQPLIQRFAKIEAVEFFPIMLAASPIVTVLISTPVQMFMAWRIVVITQSKKIPFVIAVFSIVSLAGGIWVGVQVVVFKLFSKKDSFQFNLPGVIWFVAAAVADVLITVTLVYSLRQRKTGHKKTSSLINRIIKLTIQTGLVTTITALLDLFLFTLSPKTAVSFVWDFSVSKLYTNALLSTLNARAGWNHLNEQAGDENVLFGSTIVNSSGIGTGADKSLGTIGTFQAASRGTTTFGSGYNSYELKSQTGQMTINVESQSHHDNSFDDTTAYKRNEAL